MMLKRIALMAAITMIVVASADPADAGWRRNRCCRGQSYGQGYNTGYNTGYANTGYTAAYPNTTTTYTNTGCQPAAVDANGNPLNTAPPQEPAAPQPAPPEEQAAPAPKT